MRSSTVLLIAAAAASLAIASPLKKAVKKDIVYDYVTDIVWVTVTEEVPAAAATTTSSSTVNDVDCSTTKHTEVNIATVAATTSTSAWTSTSVVPVEPSTSVVAVPTTTSVAAPQAVAVKSSPSVVAAGTSLDAADATSTNLITASLYHHNVHRANHSVSAVSWNTTLASFAATIASSCIYAHNLTPGGGGYGQNIAVFGETGDVQALGEAHEVAQASTDMWYNGEVDSFLPSYYGEANPDFSNFDSWGHFSQMVWKSTEEIGCASQLCDAGTIFSGFGSWFTVCNYGPEGNMGGEYGANVLKPLGHPTVSA